MPGESLEYKSTITHIFGKRTHLVERRRVGNHSETTDASIGRLQAYDSAERGRQADRAAGVSAERSQGLVRSDCGGRTTGRTARYAREVPRIPAGKERRVLG